MHAYIQYQLAGTRIADMRREAGRQRTAQAARRAGQRLAAQPLPGPADRRITRAAGRIGVSLACVVALAGWLAGEGGAAEAATTGSFSVLACTTQNWTVPSGITAAAFDVYGAIGGYLTTADGQTPGGAGGHVHAVLPVSAGEVLTIVTGGQGGSVGQGPGTSTSPGGTGGCNGGGTGGDGRGNGIGFGTFPGAGGGGASDVSLSGASAPLLEAAGGGGASFGGAGGTGGPQTGGNGSASATFARSATGGSQTAAGQPGTDDTLTTDGATAGSGGTGGAGGSDVFGTGGGGGGAGWYGGGGGAIDSGAGGSNYVTADASDGISDGGVNAGQGYVNVTYGVADFPSFTGSPQDGMTGQAYSYQFHSDSWPAPQYATDESALPPGLALSADGTLSGTPSTAGSYTFYVATFNPAGANNQQVTMNIDAAPQVTTQPSDQTVTDGQPVTLTAAANGYPAPSVQWQVSSDGGTTWPDVPGATSISLSFTATPAANGHSYRAVFTNTAGSATTAAASLTVKSATATLAASPAAGPVGTKVSLSGHGFPPGGTVGIRLGSSTGQLLATSTADSSGAVVTQLSFPAAAFGAHRLYAVAGGKVAATTAFIVQPRLTVSPARVAPAAAFKATVTGFKASQPVTLRLASATFRKLGTLTTNTAGSGAGTFSIPAGTKAGTYKVYAIGGAGQPTVTATMTVS